MKLRGTMRINEQGHLEIGGCDVVDLVREFGTPLYIFDEDLIRANCRRFMKAFVHDYGKAEVIYAGKAFLTTAMCRLIAQEGLGLDVVSGGELYTALKAGFPPSRIYFHGNNKSYEELALAVDCGVGRVVVDNFLELEMLERIALERGRRVPILLRVTPGIEAHTHEYIRTGQIDSKFGFTLPGGQALEAVRKTLDLRGVEYRGLHCHIGSQIFSVEPYRYAAETMMGFVEDVLKQTGLVTEELDLGGGFGIAYVEEDEPQPIEAFAEAIMSTIYDEAEKRGLKLPKVIVEPGRSIIGPAGSTAYTVGSIKTIPGVRKYVAVDGGMADNIRPALYGARYEAMVANKARVPAAEVVSITGKCCESGDMLIWDISLPPVEPGDILLIPCTGAYGYAMASNYNRLGRPAAVLVRDGQADLILRRETYEDLLRQDVLPERLKA